MSVLPASPDRPGETDLAAETQVVRSPSPLVVNETSISGEERFGLVARLLVLGAARAADAAQAKKSASKRDKKVVRKADIVSSGPAIACPITAN